MGSDRDIGAKSECATATGENGNALLFWVMVKTLVRNWCATSLSVMDTDTQGEMEVRYCFGRDGYTRGNGSALLLWA